MAGKKRRSNKRRDAKYKTYSGSNRREQHKARNMVKDALKTKNSEHILKKAIEYNGNDIIKSFVKKEAAKKGLLI